jgi:hypothetical protein
VGNTMTIKTKLQNNLAILDHDLDELRDMRQRYTDCACPGLRQSVSYISNAERMLLNKRILLQKKLDEIVRQEKLNSVKDNFLEDYRDVLA